MNRFSFRLPALAAAAGMLLSLFAGCGGQPASSSQAVSPSSSAATDSDTVKRPSSGGMLTRTLSPISRRTPYHHLSDDLTIVEGGGISVSGNTVTVEQAGPICSRAICPPGSW